jgi:hypothetical protein
MGHEKLIISESSTGQTATKIEKNVQSLRLAGEKKIPLQSSVNLVVDGTA